MEISYFLIKEKKFRNILKINLELIIRGKSLIRKAIKRRGKGIIFIKEIENFTFLRKKKKLFIKIIAIKKI